MITIAVSLLALVVSSISAAISYLSYRAGGSRVGISAHQFEANGGEHWLRIRVTNAGRSQASVEGAWASWLGGSQTQMPILLSAESSCVINFRGKLPPQQYMHDPLVVQVGLGNGRTILKRIQLDESQLGQLAALAEWESQPSTNMDSVLPSNLKIGAQAPPPQASPSFEIDTSQLW